MSTPSAAEKPTDDADERVVDHVFDSWRRYVNAKATLTPRRRQMLRELFDGGLLASEAIRALKGYRGSKWWSRRDAPALTFERVFRDIASVEEGIGLRERDWRDPLPLPEFRDAPPVQDSLPVVITAAHTPEERAALAKAHRPSFLAKAS